jgi:hypothetical protein
MRAFDVPEAGAWALTRGSRPSPRSQRATVLELAPTARASSRRLSPAARRASPRTSPRTTRWNPTATKARLLASASKPGQRRLNDREFGEHDSSLDRVGRVQASAQALSASQRDGGWGAAQVVEQFRPGIGRQHRGRLAWWSLRIVHDPPSGADHNRPHPSSQGAGPLGAAQTTTPAPGW